MRSSRSTWSFLSFDYVFLLTQGGAAGSTDVLSPLLYRNAFTNLQAGYASAIGVIPALISGIVASRAVGDMTSTTAATIPNPVPIDAPGAAPVPASLRLRRG